MVGSWASDGAKLGAPPVRGGTPHLLEGGPGAVPATTPLNRKAAEGFPRLFGVEVQFKCAIRLGDLALQAEGREAEGEKGDRAGLRNGTDIPTVGLGFSRRPRGVQPTVIDGICDHSA